MMRWDTPFRLPAPSMDQAHQRLTVIILMFAAGFMLVAGRAVDLGVIQYAERETPAQRAEAPRVWQRADIVDREGTVLATTVTTQSLYVNPKKLQKPERTALGLAKVLPEKSAGEIMRLFRRDTTFAYLKRQMTPKQVKAVNALGEPGLIFKEESRRLYPHGRLAAHAVGFTDMDGNGAAGLEYFYDRRLRAEHGEAAPLRLSLDLRVQHAATHELRRAREEFGAKRAVALVMDVRTGQLLALVSLPDFNPNQYGSASDAQRRNNATLSTYELGSGLKTFTVAAALDKGVVDLDDRLDARRPLKIANFTIHDDHPRNRYLSVPEVYAYSSNIGAARMADAMGTDQQRSFLRQLGLLEPVGLEVPEVGHPLYPDRWGRTHTLTASYGHGIAITPVNLVQAMAAMVNGGRLYPATLLAEPDRAKRPPRQVISAATSKTVQRLMRLAVVKGTGKFADVPGYRVAGKTGTAEKVVDGTYRHDKRVSSFTGVFPADDPQYLVFAMLDEPEGNKSTAGYATGGWVAAPAVGHIIERIGTVLGVEPRPGNRDFIQEAALYVKED